MNSADVVIAAFMAYVANENEVYLASETQLELVKTVLAHKEAVKAALQKLSHEELDRIITKLNEFLNAMDEEGIHFYESLGEDKVEEFEEDLEEVLGVVMEAKQDKQQSGGSRHYKKKQTRRHRNHKKQSQRSHKSRQTRRKTQRKQKSQRKH